MDLGRQGVLAFIMAWAAISSPFSSALGTVAVGDRLLVRIRPGISDAQERAVHGRAGGAILKRFRHLPGVRVVVVPPGEGRSVAARYLRRPEVLSVEADAALSVAAVPDDALFANQWGLQNTGQTGGVPGADIDAADAWDITMGSSNVAVGVIDTGINYVHEDLAANAWVNVLEIPDNGIDDDGNGYIDDIHGINAITGTGDPMDDHDHGSVVSGVIAASGNNGVGVSGVAWKTSLIGCKAFDSSGNGTESDVLTCLDYFIGLHDRANAPVNVVATNNSYTGMPFSPTFADALARQRVAGILFAAAAGNTGATNDPWTETYPASFADPDVIAVTSTDASDLLWGAASRGTTSVALGAPGVLIWGPAVNRAYQGLTGTSMAAPHVAGVIALLAAARPTDDWRVRRNLVLAGGQPIPSLAGKTVTGRRLRAWGPDGTGALSCAGQEVLARLEPRRSIVFAARGASRVPVSLVHIICGDRGAIPAVTASTGEGLALADDGQGSDLAAGDGVFSGQWSVDGGTPLGTTTLSYPADDVVTVHVVDRYRPPIVGSEAPVSFSGTQLSLTDDSVAAIDLPFGLPIGGTDTDLRRLYVTSNGTITLANEAPWPQGEPLPTVRHEAVVAPFWDDLDPGVGGGVFWGVLGSAPGREVVIEWRAVPYAQGALSAIVTFQVVMFEGSSDILFVYPDVSFDGGVHDDGGTASVGVQVAADAATSYAVASPVLHDGMSLRWRLNAAPVALANGPDVAAQGSTVTLDGTGSFDPDGGPLEFVWHQTAGAAVSVSDATSASQTFVMPESSEPIAFELRVTDDYHVTSDASVVVGVTEPASPPPDTPSVPDTPPAPEVPPATGGNVRAAPIGCSAVSGSGDAIMAAIALLLVSRRRRI